MKTTLKTFTNIFLQLLHFRRNSHKYSKNGTNERGIHRIQTTFTDNESVKTILRYYGFLTFIGLGSKNVTNNDESKNGNEWKSQKDLSHQISLAQAAIKDGNLQKAEAVLEKALLYHVERQTVGVTCVYEMLATIAYHKGKIEKSRKIIENVISYLEKLGVPPQSERLIAFRLKLARIFSKLGKSHEADKQFRQCLEVQKLKYQVGVRDEEEVKLRINCLFWYGRHLVQSKRFIEAKQCFDTAYVLTAKTKTLDNKQVMVILYHLSETLLETGEGDAALRHLLNAVILGKESNSPDLPMFYNKIGMLYLSKGVLREAKNWCESGLQRARRVHNKTAQLDGENCITRINEVLNSGPLNI